MNSAHPTYQIAVETKGLNNYKIVITFTNPNTTRKLKKEFVLHIADTTKEKDRWNVNIITGATMRYMKGQSRMKFMNSAGKREKGLAIYRIIKQATKRKGSDFLLQQLEVEGKRYNSYQKEDANRNLLFGGGEERRIGKKREKEDNDDICGGGEEQEENNQKQEIEGGCGEGEGEGEIEVGKKDKYASPLLTEVRNTLKSIAVPTPKASIFKAGDTGATFAMIGKSKSGKTTFIVNQLNRMTEKEVEEYNVIVFFTHSLNANPLKDLAPHVKKRMVMVGRFVPKILQTMKRINDETNNRFKFMVLFDDILNLRGQLLSECICTLRNVNISTVISMQYVKFMGPAQRDSVHNLYIFNLKQPMWDFMLRGFIIGSVKDEIPAMRSVNRISEAAIIMQESMGPYIIHYDQVNDETEILLKKT